MSNSIKFQKFDCENNRLFSLPLSTIEVRVKTMEYHWYSPQKSNWLQWSRELLNSKYWRSEHHGMIVQCKIEQSCDISLAMGSLGGCHIRVLHAIVVAWKILIICIWHPPIHYSIHYYRYSTIVTMIIAIVII